MTPPDVVHAQALHLARTHLGQDDLLTTPTAATGAPVAADTPPPVAAPAAGGADILGPALARLPAGERLALVHRLLGYVLHESGVQS